MFKKNSIMPYSIHTTSTAYPWLAVLRKSGSRPQGETILGATMYVFIKKNKKSLNYLQNPPYAELLYNTVNSRYLDFGYLE